MERWLICSLLVIVAGCHASEQKPAMQAAWQSPQVRHESFEATLRVLDEHPEWVPELMDVAVTHAAIEAILQDTVRRLEEDGFSRKTAKHLAADPKALKQILIATLDAVSDQPAGEDAAAQAMASRPQLAAIVISQREDALKSTLHALVEEVRKNARARAWFLQAMTADSAQLTELLASDSRVAGAFAKALAHVGVEKSKDAVEKALP